MRKKKKKQKPTPKPKHKPRSQPCSTKHPGILHLLPGGLPMGPPHRDAARMGGSHAPQIYPGIGMRCTRDPFLPSNPIRAVPPPGGGGVILGGGSLLRFGDVGKELSPPPLAPPRLCPPKKQGKGDFWRGGDSLF